MSTIIRQEYGAAGATSAGTEDRPETRAGWESCCRSDSGQGLPEYALLTAAIVVLVVTAMAVLDADIRSLFQAIGTVLSSRF